MHDNFTRLASRRGGPGERSEDQVLQVAGPVSQPEVAAGLNPCLAPLPAADVMPFAADRWRFMDSTKGRDFGITTRQLLKLVTPPSAPQDVLCPPMSGKSWILARYYEGITTHRYSSSTPVVAGHTTLRVPIVKCGRRWRMATGNVGDVETESCCDGTPRLRAGKLKRILRLDHRVFSSRHAALKYCRKMWPSARVELTNYGLKVDVAKAAYKAILAINLRQPENFRRQTLFSGCAGASVVRCDFADVERRLAIVFGLAHVQ